jgi:phosphonate transport system ATP-binding protein
LKKLVVTEATIRDNKLYLVWGRKTMIEFKDISLTYPNGTTALKKIDLSIEQGEFVVIIGLSGAGKSSLIRCINRLVQPTSGKLFVDGEEIAHLSNKKLRALRTNVGMVFQDFNLIDRLSVLRNVMMGRLGKTKTLSSILGIFTQEELKQAMENLERVDLREKAYVRADQLSGGQKQRVSIARALTQEPRIILADEPIASLDPPNSHKVMKDLRRIAKEDNLTTIVNLHYMDMALEYADRIIGMRDGEIVYDGPATEVTKQTFEMIYNRPIREGEKG